MAQTKTNKNMSTSTEKQTKSLFQAALESSHQRESLWTPTAEEYITPQEVRQLREAAVIKGQYGLYGQLRWKNGNVKSLPLSWETRQSVEAGDCLKLTSLRLVELTHQETGEVKVFLEGIPM